MISAASVWPFSTRSRKPRPLKSGSVSRKPHCPDSGFQSAKTYTRSTPSQRSAPASSTCGRRKPKPSNWPALPAPLKQQTRKRRTRRRSMQIELESSLDRWTQAALVNPEQAARIREFEAAHAPRRGARAPILIGLGLGGIMLAAGVFQFVAAHWMDLSPTERVALLVF